MKPNSNLKNLNIFLVLVQDKEEFSYEWLACKPQYLTHACDVQVFHSSTMAPSGNSQINWYYKRLANTYSTSVFISITGNQTSSPLWFFLADRHRSFFFFFFLKILVYLIIVKVIKVKLLTLNKVASSGKDKYFFLKKITNYSCSE